MSWFVHREFLPYDVKNSDVGTWLFQAQTFADGRLWRPTPEPREFFQQWQAIVRNRSYAYYGPGHALFLSIPLVFGIDPWFVPWIFSGICLLLIFTWGNRLAGLLPASLATCLMALSPFFAANASSLLSHSTGLFLTLLFLWTAAQWQNSGKMIPAIWAGFLLGFIFATRSVNAVALGLVWIPWILWTRKRLLMKELRSWIGFLSGGAMVTFLLILYYKTLSGKWKLDLFTEYWPRNHYGFGQNLGRGEPGHYFQTYADHDLKGMFKNWCEVFVKLLEWWSGNPWMSALLLIAVLFGIGFSYWRRQTKAADQKSEPFAVSFMIPLSLWPVFHIVLYSFYFTPSRFDTGPRYLVEILPAISLACGWALMRLSFVKFGKGIVLLLLILFAASSICFENKFYLENAKTIPSRRQLEKSVVENVRAPAIVLIRSFWIGHPFPIFLNRTDLKDPIIFACDRGAEDKRLIEKFPDRNAYILAVTPLPKGVVQTELVPIYDGQNRRWLKQPEEVFAPFYIGSKFTKPVQLKGEMAQFLFYPNPRDIQPQ